MIKLIYFISQLKLTAAIIEAAQAETAVPMLNVTLRPHLQDPEEQDGDFVHANLEEAKRLARDIVFDLGDKGIDVLAIAVDKDVFAGLESTGDIRDSLRTDPYGGRLLKLSQHACQVINGGCFIMPLRLMTNWPAGWQDGAPTTVH
jgi:hypothetical protein